MNRSAWIGHLLSGFVVLGCLLAARAQPVLFAGKSPSEVYRIVHQAKWNLDADTVAACTSARAGLTRGQVHDQLMLGRGTLPQSVRVLREETHEQLATVELSGRRQDRETGAMMTTRGTVWLVREEGTWRVRQESWSPDVIEPNPPPARPTP